MGWCISTQIYQGGGGRGGGDRVILLGRPAADDCDVMFGAHVAVTTFILHKEMLSDILRTPLELFMGRDMYYYIQMGEWELEKLGASVSDAIRCCGDGDNRWW